MVFSLGTRVNVIPRVRGFGWFFGITLSLRCFDIISLNFLQQRITEPAFNVFLLIQSLDLFLKLQSERI